MAQVNIEDLVSELKGSKEYISEFKGVLEPEQFSEGRIQMINDILYFIENGEWNEE